MRPWALAAVCAGVVLGCQDPAATAMAKGNLLVNKNQLPEAVKAYEEATRLAPTQAKPWELLGNVLFDLKRYGDSRDAYQKGVLAEPGAIEPHLGLARIDALKGDHATAEVELGKVLEVQPQNLYARLSRANLELEDGNRTAARDDAVAAANGAPKSPDALYVLGRAQLAVGSIDAGELAFQKLVLVAPKSGRGDYGLAMVGAARGDKPYAIAHLKAALAKPEPPLRSEILGDGAFVRWMSDPEFISVAR